MNVNQTIEWNDATIQQLRDLWADGHSTAEIGRRLGCSKNAAVGKAHRLDLPARPSPINGFGGRPKTLRTPQSLPLAAGRGLPTLPQEKAMIASPHQIPIPLPHDRRPTPLSPRFLSERKAEPAPVYVRASEKCQWPSEKKGGAFGTFTFDCTDPATGGRSYCDRHCRCAYTYFSARSAA